MDEAELLSSFAEVAVAVAGFASLVSVIGARSGGEQIAADITRLRGMLETSLLTVAFAFTPLIPFKFGVSIPASWRSAAVVFALVALVRVVLIRSRLRKQSINLIPMLSILAAQTVASILLLGASVGLPLEQVVGAYYFLLFVHLLTSIYLFMRVAMSVFSSNELPG